MKTAQSAPKSNRSLSILFNMRKVSQQVKDARAAFLKRLQGHCNPLGIQFGQGYYSKGQWRAYVWVKDDKTVLFDGSESNEQIKMGIREGMAT